MRRPGEAPRIHRRFQRFDPAQPRTTRGRSPSTHRSHPGNPRRQRFHRRHRRVRGILEPPAAPGHRTAPLPPHRRRQVPASGFALQAPWHAAAGGGGSRALSRCLDGSRIERGSIDPRRLNMTERVAQLRQASLDTKPWLSLERAALLTEFYRQAAPLSPPMLRAGSLQYILERRAIYIGPEELIVGERGPRPKGTPTYPELCCHSLEDFQILQTREKISYCVDEAGRRIQQDEIIPYWQGHSMRDRMFAEMTPEWKNAYDAGIFTEFMEQRAPGHTVLGDIIYRKGLLDLKREVADSLARLDFFNDPRAYDKQQQLRAMSIAADAVIRFAERHAEKAESLSGAETNPRRKAELDRIAAVERFGLFG